MLDPGLLGTALRGQPRTAPLPSQGVLSPQLLPGGGGTLAGGRSLVNEQASLWLPSCSGFLGRDGLCCLGWQALRPGGPLRCLSPSPPSPPAPRRGCRLFLQKRGRSDVPPSSPAAAGAPALPPPSTVSASLSLTPLLVSWGPPKAPEVGPLEQTFTVSGWRPEVTGPLPSSWLWCQRPLLRVPSHRFPPRLPLWPNPPRTRTQSYWTGTHPSDLMLT